VGRPADSITEDVPLTRDEYLDALAAIGRPQAEKRTAILRLVIAAEDAEDVRDANSEKARQVLRRLLAPPATK